MKLFSNLGLTPSFASQLNTALLIFLKKIGPSPASFCLFSFFSTTILQKSFRLQRESNSDRWCRRRARWPLDRHHGPLLKFERSQPIFYSFSSFQHFTRFKRSDRSVNCATIVNILLTTSRTYCQREIWKRIMFLKLCLMIFWSINLTCLCRLRRLSRTICRLLHHDLTSSHFQV